MVFGGLYCGSTAEFAKPGFETVPIHGHTFPNLLLRNSAFLLRNSGWRLHGLSLCDALRSALVDRLIIERFLPRAFSGVEEFFTSLDGYSPDIIISDVHLGEESGFSLLERLSAAGQATPVILMSASGDRDMAVQAFLMGACEFMAKPFDVETLLQAIHKATAQFAPRD